MFVGLILNKLSSWCFVNSDGCWLAVVLDPNELVHHGGRRMLVWTGPSALKPYIIVIIMILVLVVRFCSFLSTEVRRSKRSENNWNKLSLLRNLCRSAAFCSVSFGNSWSDRRLRFSRTILCLFLTCRSVASSSPPSPLRPWPPVYHVTYHTSRTRSSCMHARLHTAHMYFLKTKLPSTRSERVLLGDKSTPPPALPLPPVQK